jgi:hypothetical protein
VQGEKITQEEPNIKKKVPEKRGKREGKGRNLPSPGHDD